MPRTHAHPRDNANRALATQRPGSALLMVLGTLALVAVFAAIYLTLGRADRRAAAAVERRNETDRVADAAVGHALGVIGNDRIEVYPLAVPSATGVGYQQGFRRENFDAPLIDITRRSQPNPSDPETSGPGSHLEIRAGNDLLRDARIGDDAWLASTAATYLGPEDPLFGTPSNGGRVWSVDNSGSVHPSLLWLNNRDWAQISNFAPDLRFVNLHGLRAGDPDEDGVFGGFDAESGIGTYSQNGQTRARTTYALSLLRLANPRNSDSPLRAFDPTATNTVWIPGAGQPVLANLLGLPTGQDLLNVPAVWTANQRYLYFPANQPFYTLDRDGDIATWASPDFPAYQYGDADGDGFYDSRWIEIVDASDPDNILNLLGVDPGDARVFLAMRAMDLSALVNVNTATDSVVAPSEDHPLGSSPTEIDLRRLLTMSDAAIEYGIGLSLLDNYSRANGDPAGDYRGFAPFGDRNQQFVQYQPGMHDPLSLFFDGNGDGVPDVVNARTASASTFSISEEIGKISYDAIRVAIDPNVVLTGDFRGPFFDPRLMSFGTPETDPTVDPVGLFTGSRFELALPTAPGAPWTYQTSLDEQAKARFDYYAGIAAREPDGVLPGASTLFGADDLAELLTYWGVNDPAVTSTLELTVRGRGVVGLARPAGQAPSMQQGRTDRLDPLMSSRALELDRFGLGDGRINRTQDPFRRFGQDGYLSVTGKIDEEALVHSTLSLRKRITTHSGATPLRSSLVTVLDERLPALTPGEVRRNMPTSASALYSIFSATLAPEAGIRRNPTDRDARDYMVDLDPSTWSAEVLRFNSLSYGHVGPEFALRLAGHAAVNASALLGGGGGEPVAATLIIDNAARRPIQDQIDDTSNPDQRAFPWYVTAALDDPTGQRLAGRPPRDNNTLSPGQPQLPEFDDATSPVTGGQANAGRQAVNVFDLGTHPIITEVAAISIFTDVPQVAGGDAEWTTGTAYAEPTDYVLNNRSAWGPGASPALLPMLNQPITLSGVIPPSPTTDFFNPTNDPTLMGAPPAGANQDLMLHVMVFQIHNPHDVAITLGEAGQRQNPSSINPQWEDTVMHDGRPDRDGLEFPFNYYLEHAGRFYKLGRYVQGDMASSASGVTGFVRINNPSWRYRTVTIGPGQTRNFYVLAHDEGIDSQADDFRTLNARWRAVITATPGTPGLNVLGKFGAADPQTVGNVDDDLPSDDTTYQNNDGYADDNRFTGPVEEWLIRQLSINGVAPARIKEFNPATGQVIVPGDAAPNLATVRDLTKIGTDTSVSGGAPLFGDLRASERTARLWRRMTIRDDTGAFAEALGPNQASNAREEQNYVANDFLADRLTNLEDLAAPGGISFAGGRIEGTIAFEDTFGLEDRPCSTPNPRTVLDEAARGVRQDNTGWTIVRWRAARRVAGVEPEASVVPPWMVHARFGTGIAATVKMDGTSDADIDPLDIDSWAEDCGPLVIQHLGENREVWRRVRMSNGARGGAGLRVYYDAETQRSFLDTFSMSFNNRDALRTAGNPPWLVDPARQNEGTDRFNIVRSLATEPDDKRRLHSGGAFDNSNSTAGKFKVGTAAPGDPVMFQNLTMNDTIRDDDQYDPALVGTRRLTPVMSARGLLETPRPADALLAWAVGPVHAPSLDSGVNRTNIGVHNFNPDAEWLTGPEMIAMALGYERPEIFDAGDDDMGAAIDDIYYFLFNDLAANDAAAAPEDGYVLDSGRLRIDAFVPFINVNTASDIPLPSVTPGGTVNIPRPVYDEPTASGGTGQRVDIAYGDALPLALGVVDRMTGNRDEAEAALPELLLPDPYGGETTAQYAARVRNQLLASGHPFAQHLPAATAEPTPDSFRSTAQQRWDNQIKPLISLVRGRININTATPEVLRLLPGLSPFPEYREVMVSGSPAPIAATIDEEWMNFYTKAVSTSTLDTGLLGRDAVAFAAAVGAGDPVAASSTALPDVAATLVGYRDRTRAPLRALSDPSLAINGIVTPLTYGVIPGSDSLNLGQDIGTNYVFDTGRANATGIGLRDPSGAALRSPLRGARGFTSPAEILAAVYRTTDDPNTSGVDERTEVFDVVRSSLINAYAIDGDNAEDIDGIARLPVTSERWDAPMGTMGEPGNAVADDYDERLAMANGVLNTIDVRSDIFAVWFVMHIYTPDDVENLQPEDPLVPAVARRYMMVVDRSNVIGPEDKPRILLLREVPL